MWNEFLNKSNQLIQLNDDEHTMRCHVLRGSESHELDKWDLHSQKGSEYVKYIIGKDHFVEALLLLLFMSDQSEKYIDGNNVNDK